MTVLWALLRGVGAKVWLGLAGAMGLLLILLGGRRSGQQAEQAKQLRNTVRAHETRDEVERDLRADLDPVHRVERMRQRGDLRD